MATMRRHGEKETYAKPPATSVLAYVALLGGVIRINRESLGIFTWYLNKTPGQIEGMTNRK